MKFFVLKEGTFSQLELGDIYSNFFGLHYNFLRIIAYSIFEWFEGNSQELINASYCFIYRMLF